MLQSSSTVSPVAGGDDDAVEDQFDLPDLCARPQCRREFRQSVGRGRKKDYCSETCRRLADRDYKRARATVEHFEKLTRRARYDVLAFGRAAGDEDDGAVTEDVAFAQALAALDRADVVLRFATDAEPRMVAELQALCSGVRPLMAQSKAM
jgi:hypothetical protein